MVSNHPLLTPERRADLSRRFLIKGRFVYGKVIDAQGTSSSRLYAVLCQQVAQDTTMR